MSDAAVSPPPSRSVIDTRPLIVLDTNVALDVFVFGQNPLLAPLREAIADDLVALAVSDETLTEFGHILRLDKIRIEPAERRQSVLEVYRDRVEIYEVAPERAAPKCKDPDDQMFLELAVQHNAAALISRDKAILKLRKRVAKLELVTQLLTPEQWCQQWISSRSDTTL